MNAREREIGDERVGYSLFVLVYFCLSFYFLFIC